MNGIIRNVALLLGCAVGAMGIGCTTVPRSCDNGCCGVNSERGCGVARLGNGGPSPRLNGCCNYNLYDRCYPERYNNLAQREVNLAFTPQVQNGHVLDQTVWNHHFEPGTDKLTPGGLAQLQYISRRRPHPDCHVYLATALDMPYDPCCPERYCGARQELDSLRVAAVQKYLAGLNCGRPVNFQVFVHDPADVTISAVPVTSMIGQMYARYRGGIVGGGGTGSTGGASSSVGGFSAGAGR